MTAAPASLLELTAAEGDYLANREITVGMEPGEVIRDVTFDGCTFRGVVAERARLIRCTFEECTFVGGNLAMADLVDSRLVECEFIGCKLLGINWAAVTMSTIAPVPVTFTRCRLDFASFVGVDLTGAVFRDCDLREADFGEATLRRVDFTGSNLTGAAFRECDLREGNFVEATAYAIDPRTNRVRGARFRLPEALALLDPFGVDLS